MWAGQGLDPRSPLYNMAVVVDVEGSLDVDTLRSSLQAVVDADEVLRTIYPDVGGRPTREVLERVPVDLDVLDLPDARVDDDEVERVLSDRTRKLLPLDAPLFDVCVVRRNEGRCVLYFKHHHIATDAWSAGVLFRRWGQAYLRMIRGGDGAPSHPGFAAYVSLERRLRTSPEMARALEHWGPEPADARVPVSFYGVESRQSGGRAAQVNVPFGAERTTQLRRIAATAPFRGLTTDQSHYQVFVTLLLAWTHRVCDRSTLSVGSTWHNRLSADLKETLGLFIELYPLRVEIEEGETFASLGSKVARQSMANLRHVLPGASVGGGARGFPVVLNYITAKVGDFAGLPAKTRWLRPGYMDPTHKVRLHVHDFVDAGEPLLDLDLDTAVFDEPAREWAVAHFLRLFDALAEDPARELASVPLVTWEEETRFAVRGAVRSGAPMVGQAFAEAAANHAEGVAIVDGPDRVTYRLLAERVGSLATALRSRGVGSGDVVGICLERSAELVVAMLGVLEAGAAFLPLDPSHPDDRLAWMAGDAGTRLVLSSPALLERVGHWGIEAGSVFQLTGAEPTEVPPTEVPPAEVPPREVPARTPDDLAYVLYTSGSTGRPKGVEVTHEALADYVDWARRTYVDFDRPSFPLFTSPAFDMTLTSIFVPLLAGGTIVVYRDEPEFSGLLVRRVFEDDDVDIVKLSPSHLTLVRDMDLTQSRVRRLIVGGEDLKTAVARRVFDAFGGSAEVFNEYGPTEATVGCTIHRYDPRKDIGTSVPIGLPADNVGIHVLDRAGNPLPRGVKGEICITGPRVARGYRNRPEETRQAFSLSSSPGGQRMYRTGDVGRWGGAGALEYFGRDDDQVKIRGVRIELGEVEAALSRHPAVRGQAALMVTDAGPSDDNCLRCGLQSAHPEARLDASGICAPCRKFEQDRDSVAGYFGDMSQLALQLEWAREAAEGPNDTLMLFSGGKDSTYALCRIVDMGARPLVFMLDNGFISDQAKRNVRRVVDQLGLELVVGETPAMPEIFAESLARFSNVCNGCFKVIYTLAMNLAAERGIPAIVTGLSRGQIFETRLADLYRRGVCEPAEVDRAIHDARRAYHRMDDAVSRTMDVKIFQDDRVLDSVRFIDFYRYSEVELADLLSYLEERTPWIRPADTGRSTNCLINEAGIFVHGKERGFHNYTLPYSWDVRLGHKERGAALAELEDDLDPVRVRRMLDQVGYRERVAPPPEPRLVGYFVADREITTSEWRSFLSQWLPAEIIPSAFIQLDELPLTSHGKIDRGALEPPPGDRPRLEAVYIAPRTHLEEQLTGVWREVLGLDTIGVRDDFFELGGDSMHCIQIVSSALERGIAFAPRDLFAHPTVEALARVATTEPAQTAPATASASAAELLELDREFGS